MGQVDDIKTFTRSNKLTGCGKDLCPGLTARKILKFPSSLRWQNSVTHIK